MSPRTRATLAVLAIFGLVAAPTARAADGNAEGTITVNGRTTKLTHAYALAVKSNFDKAKEDVQVILSDVPLEGEALEGWPRGRMERDRMADAGKLHAMEIMIGADGKPHSRSFQDNGFTNSGAPSGLDGSDVFTRKTFDDKTVEARYRSPATHEFGGNSYSFDVSFKADIARAPKVP